jgi:hypothetical protein
MYAGVYRLLGIRDNILCQLLRVMLYKKNLLWRDLNIELDDYIHSEVKTILTTIKENEEKLGYSPTSIPFKLPQSRGRLKDTPDPHSTEEPLCDILTLALRDHSELIESIRNFSKLSEQP